MDPKEDGARMGGPTAEDFDATLAELLAGDEDAFRRVYRSLNPALVRYLSALVGPGDAEDVASETWAQVCRDLRKFRGDGDGFRGWVSTIGRHRAMDHLRAARRRPQQSGTSEAVLAERPSADQVDTDALTAISTQDALALIRTLPPDQAEAVLLRVVMGLDAKTAGRVLGKRAGAVRTAAFRGLRTLAANLGATAQPDDTAQLNATAQPSDTAHVNDTAPPGNPPRTADSDIFRALVAEELS